MLSTATEDAVGKAEDDEAAVRAAAPCTLVPVASLRRPCFEALLAQQLALHPHLHVAGAGPEVMLASLDAAITALRARGEPAPRHGMVRLTHSM